jgi:hypothetical protein
LTIWLDRRAAEGRHPQTQTKDGMISTQMMNSRTVRPRLTRAMNMPTNGDQEIHQAQ